MPPSDRENAPDETPAPARGRGGYVVRFGLMRAVAVFGAGKGDVFPRGSDVIVRTRRGLEWGTVLTEASERARKQLAGPDGQGTRSEGGRIMRSPTAEDHQVRETRRADEPKLFNEPVSLAAEMLPKMRLIDVEVLFGDDRAVFYYTADERVDFREYVKRLVGRLDRRVEVRQVGVRDEAKLLADYGDCGKPVCCGTHLRSTPPVSMKMAKVQKASLDPNKLTGRCGRLKCCLRYEYDTYRSYLKETPKVGVTVVTKEGSGRVIGQEPLARQVVVQYDDSRRSIVSLDDIVTVVGKSGRTKAEGEAKAATASESAKPHSAGPVEVVGNTPTDQESATGEESAAGERSASEEKPKRKRRRRRRRSIDGPRGDS